jgi:G:T-mismatch repair DNA endonuclease (very short patch repair protein)
MQMQFQNLVEDGNPNKNLLLNPFHNSISSFSSYIFKIFKAYFLYTKEIYSIIDEYGLCKRNFSKDELLWAQYKIFENPEKQFRYQFNHPKGQKYFKECIPDLYSPITNEVWFFMGCYWHGHSINECLKPSKTGFNKSQNKSFNTLNSEFQNKIQKFKVMYPNYEVNCTWECHFAQTKQTSKFSNFIKSGLSYHPLTRLKPRTTVRGGYNQVYNLEWNQTESIDETFFCLDINGLYSYCAINFPTNYGPYEILIGDALELVTLKKNKFFYLDNRIFGAIQLTIIPPNNLYLPYLMYKLKNQKTVLTLCKECSEQGKQFVTLCKHTDIERALTSCYLISEIEYALSLGYKISRIFEIHAYFEQKNVLNMFVKCIDSLKLKHSDFCENASDLDELCHKINTELDLPNTFCLKANDIEPNKFKKSLYKIAANSLFGKLQQRSDYAKTRFIAARLA